MAKLGEASICQIIEHEQPDAVHPGRTGGVENSVKQEISVYALHPDGGLGAYGKCAEHDLEKELVRYNKRCLQRARLCSRFCMEKCRITWKPGKEGTEDDKLFSFFAGCPIRSAGPA